MAEQLSIQMAKLVTTPPAKLQANERHGVRRLMFAQISLNASIGDTVYLGRIPVGARIIGAKLNNAAGTASSTMSIGLRRTDTKAVIDAAGLSTAVSIAGAQNIDVSGNGTLISAGKTYETPTEVDVYGTIAGAAPANQLLSVSVDYVVD